MTDRPRRFLFVLLLTLIHLSLALGQAPSDTFMYAHQEVMIPMRDAIRLNTVVYSPQGMKEAAPFLILRTPYGVSKRPSPNLITYVRDLARDGFIFSVPGYPRTIQERRGF
ncbi:MAG TPA: hypothetical protein VI704_02080 [Bacteroidota bacterium]|nr:hypothetical protein [Bacteroidota bacterium]